MADTKNTEKFSILVVDDEPSVGDALRVILESNGDEVILVATGMRVLSRRVTGALAS